MTGRWRKPVIDAAKAALDDNLLKFRTPGVSSPTAGRSCLRSLQYPLANGERCRYDLTGLIQASIAMSHDVFISYSTQDKTTADAVCAALEQHGVRCWIAPRDVLPGVEWGEAIVNAIEEAKIVVMVFSSRANESRHIRKEVERAVSRGIAIVPFRIEEIMPSRGLEYFIGGVHWLDALTVPLEAHLNDLACKVSLLLSRIQGVAKQVQAAVALAGTMQTPVSAAHASDRANVHAFCTQCGTRNVAATAFCRTCCASLRIAPANCPNCQAYLDPGLRFCTACGLALAGDQR